MDSSGGATSNNWTELVEDLLHDGDVDKAVSLLESTVSNLEKQATDGNSVAHQLSTALHDLSKVYSAKGFSLKADQALSRSIQLKHQKGALGNAEKSGLEGAYGAKIGENGFIKDGSAEESSVDDDWEAIADHTPEKLLPQHCLPSVSKLSLEEPKDQGRTRRRGRGTFAYQGQGLYSDSQLDEPVLDMSDDTSVHQDENTEKGNLMYGTHHVLVLADFPPSTRTSDLEKLFVKFKDQFVIRWVNDTTALAVFKTPSAAREASQSIEFSFSVHVLDEGDELVRSISPRDLKPPRQRPPTSARTAQRLIAHSMGIKLPSSFGTSELRKQEEARKNRIVSRQHMRDDAWGDDVK